MMAVGEDHKDCARLLLEHGADETIKTQKGKTALDLCKSKKMKMILVRQHNPPGFYICRNQKAIPRA
jgi:hypothetical protein